MENLVAILVPIACGCVLPIMVVWLDIRKKMNETNQRTQIVLAAIEKNPDMDIEELMKKISPKKKLLKEKLLWRRRSCRPRSAWPRCLPARRKSAPPARPSAPFRASRRACLRKGPAR